MLGHMRGVGGRKWGWMGMVIFCYYGYVKSSIIKNYYVLKSGYWSGKIAQQVKVFLSSLMARVGSQSCL